MFKGFYIEPIDIILVVVIFLLIIGFLFFKFNVYQVFMKFFVKKNYPKRRQFDVANLNKYQKKGYDVAKEMYKKGMIIESARLLESVGLIREAITLLDKSGKVDEAAEILLKIQRPNRAGMIYIKHGKWQEALKCFKMAGMWPEAAKCAREIGAYTEAAQYFLDSSQPQAAAECYFEGGDYRKAAMLYAQLGIVDKAIESYESLVDQLRGDLSDVHLEDFEVKLLIDYLSSGKENSTCADLLSKEGHLEDAVFNLIKNKDVQTASVLYLRTTKDIGPGLLSRIDYTDKELALRLAELFNMVSNFVYAGIIYENLNDIKNAAESFEKGQDYQRAILCYDKLNNKSKVAELKSILATQGSNVTLSFTSINKNNIPQKESPFVLEDEEQFSEQSNVENDQIFSIKNDEDKQQQNDLHEHDINIYDSNADKTQIVNSQILSDQTPIEQNHNYDNSEQTQILNLQERVIAPSVNNNISDNQFNLNIQSQNNTNSYEDNSVSTDQIVDKKYIEFLLDSRVFNTLSNDEKNLLLKEIQYISLDSSKHIKPLEGIYIVLEGKINLVQNNNIIKNILPVESFGYESFSNTSLSFEYISEQQTLLALLPCSSLELISIQYPNIVLKIYKNLYNLLFEFLITYNNNYSNTQAA